MQILSHPPININFEWNIYKAYTIFLVSEEHLWCKMYVKYCVFKSHLWNSFCLIKGILSTKIVIFSYPILLSFSVLTFIKWRLNIELLANTLWNVVFFYLKKLTIITGSRLIMHWPERGQIDFYLFLCQ